LARAFKKKVKKPRNPFVLPARAKKGGAMPDLRNKKRDALRKKEQAEATQNPQ